MAFELDVTVAGLPAGPATEASVRKQLRFENSDDRDDVSLQLAIEAVNEMIAKWRCGADFIATLPPLVPDRAGIEWPKRLALGGTMLATRLFQRRNSAEGVSSFGDEGAVYVMRNDPDIAMLLNLGAYMKPAVG